jgi:hypothetical protein
MAHTSSARTCTVYGYPGAAFVDASGEQLGPDPERAPGSPARVPPAPWGRVPGRVCRTPVRRSAGRAPLVRRRRW